MKDKWLNAGHYGENLQPYVEPAREIDGERVGTLNCSFSFNNNNNNNNNLIYKAP